MYRQIVAQTALLWGLAALPLGAAEVPPAGLRPALAPTVEAVYAAATAAGVHKLAVLPLRSVTPEQPAAVEPLGRFLAATLSSLLARRSAGGLSLADPEASGRVALPGPLDAAAVASLSTAVGPLDAAVLGTLEGTADKLRLQLTLTSLADLKPLGPPAVLDLPWDADLLTLRGLGYAFEEQRGMLPSQLQAVSAAVGHATPPDGRGPFRMELLFGDQVRRPEVRGNAAQVTVKPGETFQVRLINDTPERVGVALMLDGLNSVGRQRQLPTEAMKWVIGPKTSVIVAGWQLNDETLREFRIDRSTDGGVRATASGWITASFFAEAATVVGGGKGEENRDLGPLVVGAGDDKKNATRKVAFNAAPVPAATLAVRYEGQ